MPRAEALLVLTFSAVFIASAAFFLWAGLLLIKSAPLFASIPFAPVCFLGVIVNTTLATMLLSQWRAV